MALKNFLIIFGLYIIISINCQTCSSDMPLSETSCFNDLKMFELENKYYRAGHFASNTKGDMILEYSFQQYRLFYGLKKDGKLYYPEEIKEIELINNNITTEQLARYESINLFVSLFNDLNKENEYLMSLSSWITVAELHELETGNYNTLKTVDFFNHELGTYSYVFQLLEANYQDMKIYFCVFITHILNEQNISIDLIHIKRFGLSNLTFEFVQEKNTSFEHVERTRITSSIIYNDYQLLALFYFKYGQDQSHCYYYVRLYNYELENYYENPIAENIITESYRYDGMFFKVCNLYAQYAAILYFADGYTFWFEILVLNNLGGNTYSFDKKVTYSKNNIPLSSFYITLNDFVKIENDRLAFISTEQSYNILHIILFDLYNQYTAVKVRFYKYSVITDKISSLTKELTCFIYYGFLAFTGTVLPSTPNSDQDNFFPIFLLFGYPNGTDFTIDNIYPYLTDIEGHNSEKTLFSFLMNNMTIDNNIFSYERVEEIKLVSIPQELKFFNGSDNSLISNGHTIDINHLLTQDSTITKDNNSYSLEYQFIVKEPDLNNFYSNNYFYLVENSGNISNIESTFTPKILYGRTNTLKFKLCHKHCKTCLELGNSIIDQKCESCLDEYSYSTPDHPSECVPEGYFIDYENGSLEAHTSENSKYYIENGKTIYFKSSYDCPENYPNYDEETKECKKEENPTTILEDTTVPILEDTTAKIIEETTTAILPGTTTFKEKPNINVTNMTNDEIIEKMGNELLNDYSSGDESIEIQGTNNTVFQLTTSDNEMKRFGSNSLINNGLSIIDLGDCETSLRKKYNIDKSLSLIIVKYEQLTISAERNVQ